MASTVSSANNNEPGPRAMVLVRQWSIIAACVTAWVAVLLLAWHWILPSHQRDIIENGWRLTRYLQAEAEREGPEHLQSMLVVLEQANPELLYATVQDRELVSIAHSNPARIGMQFPDPDSAACLRDGRTVEKLYIRDAQLPSSPFHGQRAIDLELPIRRNGAIVGLISTGWSLDRMERVLHQRMALLAGVSAVWLGVVAVAVWMMLRSVRHVRAARDQLIASEAQARRSEAQLRTAIDAMPFAVWTLRRDGSYGIQNRIAAEWWGRLTDGRPEQRALDERTLAIWAENNAKAWTGGLVDRESLIRTTAGERVIRDIVVPTRTDGDIDGLLGISLDLTEQRQVERQARQSEARFVAALRVAPDAIVLTRQRDGMILDVNAGFERISGWPRDQAIGRTVIELGFFPDSAARGQIHQRLEEAGGALPSEETRIPMRDGRVIDLLIAYCVIRDDEEPLLLSVSRDISDFKRTTDDLRRSHRFNQAILDASNALIVVMDPDSRIVSFNAGAEHLLGWPAAEVVGKPWELFVPHNQRAEVRRHIANSRVSRGAQVYEHEVMDRSGRRFWVAWASTAVIGTDPDKVELVVANGIDMTALHRSLEAAFASERDAVIGRMAGRVAHEVNNPLEAIKALIEPLKKRSEAAPKVLEGLDVIDRQVDRIAKLVRALLGLVRQRSVHRTVVKPSEIMTMVGDLFQPRFSQAGKTLNLEVPGDLPLATIDADQVQQVVINLLENALAAIPHGGSVWMRAVADGPWLEITVDDDGPGLAGDAERLFQPFVTTKPNGTGLGLSVARTICEAHQGIITGENRSPHGARFHLRLRTDLPKEPGQPGQASVSGGEVQV